MRFKLGKNKSGEPRPVPEDVAEKQKPLDEGDFLDALDRATNRLEKPAPSQPDPESPRK